MSVVINLMDEYMATDTKIYPGVAFSGRGWYFGSDVKETAAPSITDSGTSVRVSITNAYNASMGGYPNRSGVALSTTAVDLTGKTTVTITYESRRGDNNSSQTGFWIHTSNTGLPSDTSLIKYVANVSGTVTITKTSGFSGSYYFGIGVKTAGNYSSTSAITVTSVVAE